MYNSYQTAVPSSESESEKYTKAKEHMQTCSDNVKKSKGERYYNDMLAKLGSFDTESKGVLELAVQIGGHISWVTAAVASAKAKAKTEMQGKVPVATAKPTAAPAVLKQMKQPRGRPLRRVARHDSHLESLEFA